ncbi:hypothetical protein F7231_09450 [Fibrella aestuarina]|uniref:Uncharacterized protein n=1 Tax=Fibrivirga algicola TaxID=2950420 RepID=A0ABX0QHH0_9BACT|nr:hypothetical protein A6C57_03770 [Fibrella sp. ES10-3-2-2]NID10397.1 hypothetical protein [Fibrivirga algicola]
MKKWGWVIVTALFMCFGPDVLAQCAMCRATVESTVSNGRSVVASDLNFGILYLLAAPYLIVAGISYMWYRTSKKEHAQRIKISSRVKGALSQM